MPFLLPALTALVSDVVILYLVHHGDSSPAVDSSNEVHAYIYNIQYASPLAIIRLILLFLPLLYHSYRGTAIKCPLFYQLLYGGTLLVVLFQMLGIMILDPDSLSTLVPSVSDSDRWRQLQSSATAGRLPKDNMRQVWLVTTLTLLSDLLHIVLLWHVRSTAPADWNNSARKHVLYFYTQHQQQQQQNDGTSNGGSLTNGLLFHRDSDDYDNENDPFTNGNVNNGFNGKNANGNHHHDHHDPLHLNQPYHRSASNPMHTDLLQQMRCLPDGYDDIMSGLQHRFQHTKDQWAQRLEDFTIRMSQRSSTENGSSHGGGTLALHLPLSPFRVLLQLFAYEKDILPQLDLVFEKDDGVALTFYVPQLLSFLLHGAYHNAPDLEEWILGKCRSNVHFAHKCYWFLRAWCLEGSHAETQQQMPAGNGNGRNMSRNNSFSSLLGVTEGGGAAAPPRVQQKYPPEERSAMLALMHRVMECGELPAQQQLHYAPSEGVTTLLSQGGAPSPSDLVEAMESGYLPVDPALGSPSVRHLDSVSAQDKMGLLPKAAAPPHQNMFLETPKFLDAMLALADSLFLLSREQRTEELRRQLRRLEVEFLPANAIYMPVTKVQHWVWRIVAEESIAISTKERVPCIIALEVVDYAAPSSSRSRGFSATGLLDLMRTHSTDSTEAGAGAPPLTPPKKMFGSSAAVDEREVVRLWRTAPKNPRRFESIFDKVTSFTRSAQETLHKFQRQKPQDDLTWTGGRGITISESEHADEEAVILTRVDSGSAPSTPVSKTRVLDPCDAMGQWSSPISSYPSPLKSRVLPQRSSSGRLLSLRNERTTANGEATIENEENSIDALLDIRHSMEIRKESEKVLTANEPEASGAYGATQKLRATRAPPVVFKESWAAKEDRIRKRSAYGSHPKWRLLPILIKSNDDLRQEQLASQLIYRMASILAQEKVPVWLCPYEIVALTDRGGIIEAIPDTISLDSLKRNDPNFDSLPQFFENHFEGDDLADAKANFVESLAAYSVVCYLLQIKDRHNGNILLDNRGHIIHIDFGFFFLSSPGKNSGFESAPFKLTADFVDFMGGPHSNTFHIFRQLCCRTFLTLRKHCFEITLLVEMLMVGNEDLNCFRGRPEDAVRGLRERFRLDLNDRACTEYVNGLVDESLENWRTRWYDRYQRFCVGVL